MYIIYFCLCAFLHLSDSQCFSFSFLLDIGCGQGQQNFGWQPQQAQPAFPGQPAGFTTQLQPPMPESMKTSERVKVSSSVGTVVKIPKAWQVKGIEALHEMLDCTLLGKFDQNILAIVLWLLTDIKPNFKMADLMVAYYDELGAKYLKGADCVHFDWLTEVLLVDAAGINQSDTKSTSPDWLIDAGL